MLPDDFAELPLSVQDTPSLNQDFLQSECDRLLECMETRVTDFESSTPGQAWAWRGLDEVLSMAPTFRQRLGDLSQGSEDETRIRARAESLVDRFMRTDTRLCLPGEPTTGRRHRLRTVLGLKQNKQTPVAG